MLYLFDLVLLVVIVLLAWRSLNDADLFRGTVSFIALGLLIAVAWVRLRAPDVALAEAAVGSGLTGALILSALVRMRRRGRDAPRPNHAGGAIPRRLIGVLLLALFLCLCGAMLRLAQWPEGLTETALAELPASGVSNPVTAVLLNYRSYDTLLEVAVLLLAIVGVWSLRRAEWPGDVRESYPLLMPLLRIVLPTLVLAAAYVLWIGTSKPGGAFQGGALAGGAFVLMLLGGFGRRALRHRYRMRVALSCGLLVFIAASVGTMLLTGEILRYPAGFAGHWILAIEAAALISIACTLGLLYLGGRPEEAGDGTPVNRSVNGSKNGSMGR